MKKVTACTVMILFIITQQNFAQKFYYSGGQKNFLTEDSSFISLKLKTRSYAKWSSILALQGIQEIDSSTRGVTNLKVDKSADKKSLIKQLQVVADVEYAWPTSLEVNDLPLIPTGEILLALNDGLLIDDLVATLKLNDAVASTTVDEYKVQAISLVNPGDVFTIANTIYESKLVKWCHPNFYAPVSLGTNDPLYVDQYYFKNTGQFGGTTGIDIRAEGAWAVTTGNGTVKVAVVDNGVEDHEDLVGRVLAGYAPKAPLTNGRPVVSTAAHGTNCAGIIAAIQNNSKGIGGLANCRIVPVNIFVGAESVGDQATGINQAYDPTKGDADIISNSWYYTNGAPTGFDVLTTAVTNAMTLGRDGKGCVVIFISGNHKPFRDVSYPGNITGVITVGAVDNMGALWNYSDRGPSLDLVAPSGDWPIGNVRTLDRMGSAGNDAGNYTSTFGATSAAAPQVSGVAALMLSLNPNLTYAQVRSILQTTATDRGAAGFDNSYGYGLLNSCAAIAKTVSDGTSLTGGLNTICTGSSTYTLPNVPASAPVQWSIFPITGVVSIASSGNQATLTKTGNGWVTLTAKIVLSGCAANTYSKTKTIRVGTYLTSEYNLTQYPDPVCYTGNVQVGMPWYYQPPETGTTYNWIIDQARLDYVTGQGTSIVTVKLKPNIFDPKNAWVAGRANNSCGTGPTSPGFIIEWYPCSGFVLSPNPASGEVTIEEDPATKVAGASLEIQQVEIVDRMGIVVQRRSLGNGNTKTTLGIRALKNDVYVVRIFDGKKWHFKQLVVSN
jgi:serine protease